MNDKSLYWKKFIYRLKKFLMVSLLVVIIIPFLIKNCIAPTSVNVDYESFYRTYREMINKDIIEQVDVYIKRYAPESTLSAEMLVEICDKCDFDLKLTIAQAHLESHFGTRGRAVETNSVFNVGTYDNGEILYRYSEPNESIQPYVDLIQNYYLVEDKSVDDLLYQRFVNIKGKRYSSSRRYETKLIEIMDIISIQTELDRLLAMRNDCDSGLRKLMGIPEEPQIIEPQNYLAYKTNDFDRIDDEFLNLSKMFGN